MLIELQPDGSKKLLNGDDATYHAMIKRLTRNVMPRRSSWGAMCTYEGTNEVNGGMILHMEDGSYKTVLAKEDYAHNEIIDHIIW